MDKIFFVAASSHVIFRQCLTILNSVLPSTRHHRHHLLLRPAQTVHFPRALLLGIVGAAIGMALYAGFTILTNIQIGYMSLAVGFIVAKAMMIGSKGIGGRQYQITAAVLTYAAVSMAFVPLFLYATHLSISDVPLGKLIQLGLTSPFLELQADAFHGLIGLVILLVGVRIAWRLTAAKPQSAV